MSFADMPSKYVFCLFFGVICLRRPFFHTSDCVEEPLGSRIEAASQGICGTIVHISIQPYCQHCCHHHPSWCNPWSKLVQMRYCPLPHPRTILHLFNLHCHLLELRTYSILVSYEPTRKTKLGIRSYLKRLMWTQPSGVAIRKTRFSSFVNSTTILNRKNFVPRSLSSRWCTVLQEWVVERSSFSYLPYTHCE